MKHSMEEIAAKPPKKKYAHEDEMARRLRENLERRKRQREAIDKEMQEKVGARALRAKPPFSTAS